MSTKLCHCRCGPEVVAVASPRQGPEELEYAEEEVETTKMSSSNSSYHWGQGVVYRAGTLQVHCKEMNKEPTPYPPSISQVHSEFPSQFHCSVPSAGNAQYIHSVPGHVIAMS